MQFRALRQTLHKAVVVLYIHSGLSSSLLGQGYIFNFGVVQLQLFKMQNSVFCFFSLKHKQSLLTYLSKCWETVQGKTYGLQNYWSSNAVEKYDIGNIIPS